jgi:hypothetical protein
MPRGCRPAGAEIARRDSQEGRIPARPSRAAAARAAACARAWNASPRPSVPAAAPSRSPRPIGAFA